MKHVVVCDSCGTTVKVNSERVHVAGWFSAPHFPQADNVAEELAVAVMGRPRCRGVQLCPTCVERAAQPLLDEQRERILGLVRQAQYNAGELGGEHGLVVSAMVRLAEQIAKGK